MMHGAATFAIVGTRLRKELRILAFTTSACALFAALQPRDAAAQFAGALFFGTLIGIAVALLQRGDGRFRELELCEQSAPLYGRELARATAFVPCTIVTAALAAYWIAGALLSPPAVAPVLITIAAANAATLIALSTTLRRGAARFLYIGFACAASALVFAARDTSAILSLAICLVAGFLALRQYGEALARYDPI